MICAPVFRSGITFVSYTNASGDHIKNKSNRYLTETYVRALVEVVQHYAAERPNSSRAGQGKFEGKSASVIGFGADKFRGSSALIASESVTRSLANDPTVDPFDWLGELNNQVVGRLINSIARCGILAHMGTPMTVDGQQLELRAVGAEPAVWLIDWSGGPINGLLAIEYAEEFDCDSVDQNEIAAEGSLTMF